MLKLLQAYLSLILLRLGPQDLPASRFLLQFSAVATVLSGCLMLSLKDGLTIGILLIVAVDLGLSTTLIYLGLRITGKTARLSQTLSALFGSSAMIQMMTIPLILLIGADPVDSQTSQFALLIFMLLLAWSLTVIGHILRHAMDFPVWVGLTLAIGYWIFINDFIHFLGFE